VSDHRELADFLRARREALHPADVGLPDTGRRRAPGLRREEVATLAGVSIDYLVRLEQGRDLHPSAGVLAALAKALRLDDDERLHLARLAAHTGQPELCPATPPLRSNVAPGVRQLLDSLDDTPAFVAGPANDLLAWNRAFQQLAGPLGMLDGAPPNLVRYVFTDPRARTVYLDWPSAADEQVRRLRAAEPRWRDDEAFQHLLGEVRPLPDFSSRWSAHAVAEKHRGVKRIRHPDVGELRVGYEVLLLPDDGEQRLITWLPADEADRTAFNTALAGGLPVSPAKLRVVNPYPGRRAVAYGQGRREGAAARTSARDQSHSAGHGSPVSRRPGGDDRRQHPPA
jgi:transcriptional regulator with XRE-family HTH domain